MCWTRRGSKPARWPCIRRIGPCLSRHEQAFLEQPWQAVREGVQVKLLAQEGEVLVLAQSKDRVNKERSMRRRQLTLKTAVER